MPCPIQSWNFITPVARSSPRMTIGRTTQKAQIMATGLAPTNARESAIYATLPAGAYTAVVRGVNGATGIAVAEAYNLSK